MPRSEPDDAISRHDARYLGPPGFTLPFYARYSAYGLYAATVGAALLLEAVIGVLNGPVAFWTCAVGAALTTWVMGHVNHERPAAAVLTEVYAEVRHGWHRPSRPHAHAPRMSRIRTRETP